MRPSNDMSSGCQARGFAGVSLHETSPARAAQTAAKVVSLTTRVGTDLNVVECRCSGAVDQQRYMSFANNSAQTVQSSRIHRKRVIPIKAGGDLHAPKLGSSSRNAVPELSDKIVGRAFELRQQPVAIGARCGVGQLIVRAAPRPRIDTTSGNGQDVVAGLPRHLARAG